MTNYSRPEQMKPEEKRDLVFFLQNQYLVRKKTMQIITSSAQNTKICVCVNTIGLLSSLVLGIVKGLDDPVARRNHDTTKLQ